MKNTSDIPPATTMSYHMHVPTDLYFGSGELNNLHKRVLPGKKALVVISNGKSTRANGYLSRLEEQLRMAGVDDVVFDRIEPNPLKSTVMAGAAVARENGCDFVIALGGGSPMDASKAIAAMATNEGDLWDYIAFGSGKGKTPQYPSLPLVSITTTAGTGSETDTGAVITNAETQEKTAFFGDYPVLAIVDPELTASVPPAFTAYQGFDALFHSIEGYISKAANLMSDMYALTAIENIGRYLPRAVRNGRDMEARERVAFANSLSGVVMCVGQLTSEHPLEHAMSAYHPALPHGAGLIMLSLAFYRHFIDAHVCDERFVRMAKALGKEDAAAPGDFLEALAELEKACGVAELKMSDYGIAPDEFPTFARNAKETLMPLFLADRALLSDEDCIGIYAASYK